MNIPWSLKGATVHNAVMALCISPSMHTFLDLEDRCEAALSGFLSLDIFRLCSEQLAVKYRLPTGSTFLAGQTVFNLQGTALATITICCSKPASWCPWKFGSGRLSEIAVEQMFGNIRCQSAIAQHTARSYFSASARYSIRMKELLRKVKPPAASAEPCLSDAQWFVYINPVL